MGTLGDLSQDSFSLSKIFAALEGRFHDLSEAVFPKLFRREFLSIVERGIDELRQTGGTLSEETLTVLAKSWGNRHWAALTCYLGEVIQHSMTVRAGTILECGSGLSTVILAMVSRVTGISVISLEHVEHWLRKTEAALTLTELSGHRCTPLHAPLRAYQGYSWYDTSALEGFIKQSGQVKLVVCDGPPRHVEGGRYGLLPQAAHLLASNCCILLDDAARKDELSIMERWQREYAVEVRIDRRGRGIGFIRIP